MMGLPITAVFALSVQLASRIQLGSAQDTTNCNKYTVDFVLTAGDTLSATIEDDIRADLAKVGITVNTIFLGKDDFNAAMRNGSYHLAFTETWGPPYDPHTFAQGWFGDDAEAHYTALQGLAPPMSKQSLEGRVIDVQREENEVQRAEKWESILQDLHHQAISYPLWSRIMPAVWRRARMTGYQPGLQQFEYPMHTVQILDNDYTLRVAPGAQTGIFSNAGATLIGRMDPHSYRPNEFFINDWIYEGLVSYGPDGVILPTLVAEVPLPVALPNGGERWTFKLRSGVKFHDGTDLDCDAVKLNFDHVLAQPLRIADYHGWYRLPAVVDRWECTDSMTFTVDLTEPFYPFLQELAYIRPIRIISPQSFAQGAGTDPYLNNSCPVAWGTIEHNGMTVNCGGVTHPSGTGPWKYSAHKLTPNGNDLAELHFARHGDWWGWSPQSNVQEIHVITYSSAADVEAALLAGSLDMVVGGGVLAPLQVREFQTTRSETFEVKLGHPLMNRIIVMNAGKAPTNNLQLRTVIMHAANKAAIVRKEMAGMAEVADSLFPKDAPYCNVDLTPRWDYDFEKARLLNCPEPQQVVSNNSNNDDDDDTGLILGLALGIGIPLVLIVAGICFFVGRNTGYSDLDGKDGKASKGKVWVNSKGKDETSNGDVIGATTA